MRVKQWLVYACLIIITLLGMVFFLMIYSDTYSNIHTDRREFFSEPNKNAMKVEYILKNKQKYDSFIFGSSRVALINPFNIKNGNYYNMTYSEGIPKEHLLNIRLFIDSGVKIKNLLIGLDDFSYQVSFDKHQNQPLTKAHYLASKTNFLIYCSELYFRFPLGEDRKHMKIKLFGGYSFKADLGDQESFYIDMQSKFSREKFNTREHIESSLFDKPTFYNGNTLNNTLQDIKEIKELCDSNKINCAFFINPIHHKTYEFTNLNLLNKFRYNLSKITNYYDFSYPNKISKDNTYWIETSHYTVDVGQMMIDTMYKEKKYENFGKFIHKIGKN